MTPAPRAPTTTLTLLASPAASGDLIITVRDLESAEGRAAFHLIGDDNEAHSNVPAYARSALCIYKDVLPGTCTHVTLKSPTAHSKES